GTHVIGITAGNCERPRPLHDDMRRVIDFECPRGAICAHKKWSDVAVLVGRGTVAGQGDRAVIDRCGFPDRGEGRPGSALTIRLGSVSMFVSQGLEIQRTGIFGRQSIDPNRIGAGKIVTSIPGRGGIEGNIRSVSIFGDYVPRHINGAAAARTVVVVKY